MSVAHHFWKGRRVRVAGALDQVAVATRDDLATIYRDYWDLVYRRCLGTLNDHEAALDAAQDVFVAALGSFEDIQHDIVRGLIDLARTLSYERKRRPAREVAFAQLSRAREGGDDPAEIAERHDVLDAVWAGLSPLERRYLADKFAGFSFEEIARRNRRALGTVSSNLARAREHARRMREPMVPAVIGLGGWRRLTELTRRARNALYNSPAAAAAQPVQTLTISLTLAGLLGGTASAVPLVAAMPAAAWLSEGAPARAAAVNLDKTAARVAPTAIAHSGHAAQPATPTSTSPVVGRGTPQAFGSPVAETPEDTQIVSAAPSPHFAQDSTVVALGWGNACGCNVLLRSTDGGATWTTRPGPADGDQLVLPPDYPRDPRIFVGFAAEAAGAADYWTPEFGRQFRPLAMPAGALALPAGFDSGDERVIVSSRNGIWGLDWTTHVVQPLVVDRDVSGTPAVASPLDALTTGVLAITSSAAITPSSMGSALTSSGDLELWTCPPEQACHNAGAVPLASEAAMSASPGFAVDHSILAYTRSQVVLSRDGGGSFERVGVPPVAINVNRAALGFPVDGQLPIWMLVQREHGFALEFASTPSGPWAEVDQGLPQITEGGGQLIPLAPHRFVYLSSSTGFVCTANDGLSWSTRCPSA